MERQLQGLLNLPLLGLAIICFLVAILSLLAVIAANQWDQLKTTKEMLRILKRDQ